MTVAEHLLPRWLVTLRTQASPVSPAPTVTLIATNSDGVIAQVRDHAIDLGFTEGPRVPADIRRRIIGTDQLVLVVSPQHPWASRRRPVTARALAAAQLVAREPGSGTRGFLEAALRDALGSAAEFAAPAMEFATATSVKEAVRANLGPAVLSSLAVDSDLREGRLIAIPMADLTLVRKLHAVWAGSARLPAGPARDLLTIAARSTSR